MIYCSEPQETRNLYHDPNEGENNYTPNQCRNDSENKEDTGSRISAPTSKEFRVVGALILGFEGSVVCSIAADETKP